MDNRDNLVHLSALELEIMQVLVPRGSTYGLEVLKLLNAGRRQHNLPEIQYGSFYPALKKLERAKLLDSDWGGDGDRASNGARRRYYQVNGLGQRTFRANDEYQRWVGMQGQLEGV
jgi:DNA-binding PadR family transcriptional regulator